jgi:hypothetical protein
MLISQPNGFLRMKEELWCANFLCLPARRKHPLRLGCFAFMRNNKSIIWQARTMTVPAVPYVLFYDGDFAVHGAYWHNDFGTPVSHGCINLRVEDARWLFDWAAVGMLIHIHY